MTIPSQFQSDVAKMPETLRDLLVAELARGNEIEDLIHTFPAPPVGCCVRLARPLSIAHTVCPPDVKPCRFPNWDGSSGLSDELGHFFLLGPPVLPPDPPSMDEIRAMRSGSSNFDRSSPSNESAVPPAAPDLPLRRFERSMAIDYEKWHDGIGYDLDAISEASAEERRAIEALVLERGVSSWRDVEALAYLNTPAARQALVAAKHSRNHEVPMAILEHAPDLLSDEERTAMIVRALRQADVLSGLTPVLDQAEAHHPPAVIEALLSGALERGGDVAVHFAALLMFLHGKADSSFDWAQRPFFLTFNTSDRDERAQAFTELCRKIGRDPDPYVTQFQRQRE